LPDDRRALPHADRRPGNLPERRRSRPGPRRRNGQSVGRRLLRRGLVVERPALSLPPGRAHPLRALHDATFSIATVSGILEAMPLTKTQAVLVVEDEASIASFVSLYLKNAGYDVSVAETGEDAI